MLATFLRNACAVVAVDALDLRAVALVVALELGVVKALDLRHLLGVLRLQPLAMGVVVALQLLRAA